MPRKIDWSERMLSLAIQAGRLSSRPHIPMLEENNARQGFVDHAQFLALRDVLPDHVRDPVAFLIPPAGASGKCAGSNGVMWTFRHG